jgi:spore cortex formation protein SpoVR/YcgB (stage V sporulation)
MNGHTVVELRNEYMSVGCTIRKPLSCIKDMNVEALHLTLQQSFSPDASLRDPAEATIRNLKNIPGSTVMLLQVAAEKQVRMSSKIFESAVSYGLP